MDCRGGGAWLGGSKKKFPGSQGVNSRVPSPFFQFEQENQRLVGEMNNLFDEVRYNFLLLATGCCGGWAPVPRTEPGQAAACAVAVGGGGAEQERPGSELYQLPRWAVAQC